VHVYDLVLKGNVIVASVTNVMIKVNNKVIPKELVFIDLIGPSFLESCSGELN